MAELITHALDRISSTALNSVAPISLAELAALAPEISERIPDLPQLSNDFPEARQARMSRAVEQLLEASVARQPTILMVDDIQWADNASAQVLHYLARHAAQRPLLVIYAYRDEAIDNDERFAQLIESLHRDTLARRIPLARMSSAETEEIIKVMGNPKLNPSQLAQRLHRETDGNPFFLMSILHALSAGETPLETHKTITTELLPEALRAAVRVRLAHVPKGIRPILDTAAVLGRRFDFDTLLAVSHEPEEQLFDAIDVLVKRRLLREEPEGGVYDFNHDKLREVVYRDIGGARRRLLHRTVAQSLEQLSEGSGDERNAQLAEHYERAQVWSKALHYLVLAGEHSQRLFSLRDALSWLDRAVLLAEAQPESLDPQQQLSLYEKRGIVRAQAGQTQGAVEDIRRVIETLRAQGEMEKTRDALIQLGMAYRRADHYEEATTCLYEALAISMHDKRHTADTLYHLGTVAWSTGKNDQAIEFHQQAVDICERMGFTDLIAVQAYHGRGEAHFANAEPAAAIACYTRSLALAREIGDKGYESENLMMIGHACIGTRGLGDYPRAIECLDKALEIAQAVDLQWHFGPTLLGIDHARACTGHYGEAWQGMQKTLHWLEELKQTRYQLIAYDCIGHLLLDLGLNEQLIAQLEGGVALSRATGIEYWRAAIDTHLAVARSRLGQVIDIATLQLTLDQTRHRSERYMMVRCLEGLAEITLRTGDTSHCRIYTDELLTLAQQNELHEIEAIARHWRGEAMLAENDFAAAQAELEHAAALVTKIGRIRLQWDIHKALARLALAQGQSNAAKAHTTHAQDLLEKIRLGLGTSGMIMNLT